MSIVNDKSYLVYAAVVDEEIVYIGSGKMGRERHCNSGTSHCFLLNEIFFTTDKEISIQIMACGLSKDDSIKNEKLLIIKNKPKGNKVHNDDMSRIKSMKRYITIYSNINKIFDCHKDNTNYRNRNFKRRINHLTENYRISHDKFTDVYFSSITDPYVANWLTKLRIVISKNIHPRPYINELDFTLVNFIFEIKPFYGETYSQFTGLSLKYNSELTKKNFDPKMIDVSGNYDGYVEIVDKSPVVNFDDI